MLSADMQKEGLGGRTLTLKLKTASFEVLIDFCVVIFPSNGAGKENY